MFRIGHMGHPSPYDGQTDEQLMESAKQAMLAAMAEAPGTVERAMKWAAHESIMQELGRRLMRQWMHNICEQLGLPDIGP